jgi:O-acetyl-ADP-ribose deacetylase (regulator of RNase III)
MIARRGVRVQSIVPLCMFSRKRANMIQNERIRYLIGALLAESPDYKETAVPDAPDEQWQLLRSLMNVRPAAPVSNDFLKIQDEYLTERIAEQGIVDAATLPVTASDPRIVLWKGDITTLRIDAVVNAANSRMEGCWQPCHACIDNCIHTFSGVQLRMRCHEIMKAQGHEEPTGQAKITPGYNLPAKYVLHTVGPIIDCGPSKRDCDLLASCYASCLKLAEENGCRNIAFCCISTGVFRFPQGKAAEIAVRTVKEFLNSGSTIKRVVFNVFTPEDERIYRRLIP